MARGREILRQLIDERRDAPPPARSGREPAPPVEVWPPDALDNEHQPPGCFFYRPDQLLVWDEPANLRRFEAAATELGLDARPAPPNYVVPVADFADADFADDGLTTDTYVTIPVNPRVPSGAVRYVVAGLGQGVPDVCASLLAKGVRVSPNHVVFGCQTWEFWPDGDPAPATPAQQATVLRDFGLARRHADGHGVKVAVVDSGLPRCWWENPLLANVECAAYPASSPVPGQQELEPYAWAHPRANVAYPQGHGAFACGVVAQFAPDARVVSYRALDGKLTSDEWALACQLSQVVDDLGDQLIVNLSLGFYTMNDDPPLALGGLAALLEKNRGTPIFFAAAGNVDHDRPFYPAAEPWTVTVGATEEMADHYQRAPFSDFGTALSTPRFWVQVCSPGVNVASSFPAQDFIATPGAVPVPFPPEGWGVWSGTSFATPRVCGIAAARASHQQLNLAGGVAAVLQNLQANGGPVIIDPAGRSIGVLVL